MFYYITLKYGNFLFETLDTFPLLKDAYTQSRKLYENRIKILTFTSGRFESRKWPKIYQNLLRTFDS
jgi:hypothetical protein